MKGKIEITKYGHKRESRLYAIQIKS